MKFSFTRVLAFRMFSTHFDSAMEGVIEGKKRVTTAANFSSQRFSNGRAHTRIGNKGDP